MRTLRPMAVVACLGGILLACAQSHAPPPRAPAAESASARTCKVAGEWCAYDADCCSGRCESESVFCR